MNSKASSQPIGRLVKMFTCRIAFSFLLPIVVAGSATNAFAYDTAGYKARLDATLSEVSSGTLADPSATLARLDELISLGIVGVRDYGAQ